MGVERPTEIKSVATKATVVRFNRSSNSRVRVTGAVFLVRQGLLNLQYFPKLFVECLLSLQQQK